MKKLFKLFISLLFFIGSVQAGVIVKVTKAELSDSKQVIFFHDKHEGKVSVGSSWHEVFDLADKQEKPLQLFVEQLLQNTSSKVPVLLECREELKKFLQTHDGQLLTLKGYFNKFYKEFAKPYSDYTLATQCDFDNFDVRDETDLTDLHDKFVPMLKRISPDHWPKDGLLLGFRTRGMWEDLDQKKNSKLQELLNDPEYQQEKQDLFAKFKNMFTRQSVLQVKQRALDLIEQLKPYLPEDSILPLKMSMEHRLSIIDDMAKRYDNEDLLVGIYNYLEKQEGSFVQLGSDLKQFMYINNIPVDLQLLYSILSSQEPVMIVHAGALHIDKVLDDLRGLGAEITSVIPFETEQEIDDAQVVFNKLRTLLPEKSNSVQQEGTGFCTAITAFFKKIWSLIWKV